MLIKARKEIKINKIFRYIIAMGNTGNSKHTREFIN